MAEKPMEPQALAALALLESYPGDSAQAAATATDLFEDLAGLRGAVVAADWNDVFDAATNCLGRGSAVFQRMQGDQLAQAARREHKGQVFADAAASVEQVLASQHRNDWIQGLRDELSGDPELLAELEADLDALEQGEADSIPLLDEALSSDDDTLPRRELSQQAVVASLTQGLLGLVHAELNRALGSITVPDGGWPGISEAFRYETARFGDLLRDKQVAIYQALGTKPVEDCLASATALTTFLEQGLPRFARAQARARLAIPGLVAGGEPSSANELGALTTLAGRLTREGIASQAAAYRLAFDVLEPAGGQLTSLAGSAPFDKPLPTGAKTALADVPATQDGTLVEVEGFVRQVRVVRSSDGKLIGQLTVSDPVDGSEASIAMLFVQPLHVGITVGAHVAATGTFSTTSKLHEEGPAVEATRLSLARLAQQAWRPAFLRSATPFYENWRNQTAVYWALGPHDKIDAEGSFVQGAGELVYSPFVRGS